MADQLELLEIRGEMIAYKVVERLEVGGKLVSAFAYARGFPSFVIYDPGVETLPKPRCGPLTAFAEKKQAAYWKYLQTMDGEGPLELWECEVELEEDERCHQIWYYIPNMDVIQTMKGVWEIPEGTIYCKSITLKKKVRAEPKAHKVVVKCLSKVLEEEKDERSE